MSGTPTSRASWYRRGGKRALDLTLLVLLAPVALPLGLLVALAVALSLGRPVLFSQTRPGKDERLFLLRKFRTMTDARDRAGAPLPDDRRLTRFGGWLRRTSLDELPELWNVLTGDMSLVGPRPLLPEYLPRYDARQRRRHEIRPGITGWAQVNGRNAIEWDEKLELDVRYVERLGPALDLRILLRTAGVVLTGRGVSASGHSTMPRFRGTQQDDGGPWNA